jgi:ribose 5-phosphate isomerase RpiB
VLPPNLIGLNMTISEYLKTTDHQIQDLQYKKRLEVELKKAKEQVAMISQMLKAWGK